MSTEQTESELGSEVDDQSLESQEDASAEEESKNLKWYTLQCFSMQEYKVRARVEQMIEDDVFDSVKRVLLPEEETIEINNNVRVEKVVKMYPGYVFVQMEPDAEDWFRLKQIAGVLKLVGHKDTPTPISRDEVDRILRNSGDRVKKIEVDFEVDEMIKVLSGPFRGYTGVIIEINPVKGKIKALISIFGRETPVELDFDHVEKVSGT